MITKSRLSYFFFAYLDTTEPISLMFVLTEIFTILKGLDMISIPYMPLRSSSLHVSLTCLGVSVNSAVLN